MRILFVAMSNSIHTVRWIKQLEGLGWDLHLFPSWVDELHPELTGVTVHNALHLLRPDGLDPSVSLRGRWLPYRRLTLAGAYHAFPKWMSKEKRLARVVRRLKPDLVHSLEIQHGGYLTLHAKRLLSDAFPPWIVTNWGSDTYLYGRLAAHRPVLQEVFASCDYYDCECERDVRAARDLGFKGDVLPVVPNTGGFRLEQLEELRTPGPTSARRLIALKGYQDTHGRALVGVRALGLCAELLKERGYKAIIYCGSHDVAIAAELVTQATGFQIEMQPPSPHEEMLRLHGRARVSMGLAISDGASTSFLEALAMGSFPVQSCTASADEWITDGESGLIVPPEDPEIVAQAIRRAVTDDDLVDRAAVINARTVRDRLGYDHVRNQVVEAYANIGRTIGAIPAGSPQLTRDADFDRLKQMESHE